MDPDQGTVFIIDDDDAIRRGLSMLLDSHGYQVEVFASGGEFLARCARALPERCMAILDLSMPEMNGLELQTELSRRHVAVPIVFLSGEGDIPAAVGAVQHGAVDFIEKPVDTDLLLDRINQALELHTLARESEAADKVVQSRLDTLTAREREVLENIVQGKISKAIAHDLGISERTIEIHRSRILKKMGVRNTTELLNRVIPVLQARNTGGK